MLKTPTNPFEPRVSFTPTQTVTEPIAQASEAQHVERELIGMLFELVTFATEQAEELASLQRRVKHLERIAEQSQ